MVIDADDVGGVVGLVGELDLKTASGLAERLLEQVDAPGQELGAV